MTALDAPLAQLYQCGKVGKDLVISHVHGARNSCSLLEKVPFSLGDGGGCLGCIGCHGNHFGTIVVLHSRHLRIVVFVSLSFTAALTIY